MLRAAPRWRAWLGLGVALFGLNLALSFHNWWPTPWITTRHTGCAGLVAPSPDPLDVLHNLIVEVVVAH